MLILEQVHMSKRNLLITEFLCYLKDTFIHFIAGIAELITGEQVEHFEKLRALHKCL